jgi:transforming growth factor-beta-induced protein
MRSRQGIAAGAVALSLLAAACGSDASPEAVADTTVAAVVTTAAAETTVAETAAPAASTEAPAATEAPALPNIVETAVAAGSFTTLTKLVTDAGLVETLQGPGPFTVFAPTDEAFAAVPPEVLTLLGASKELLTEVLTYHVVNGAVLAADVTTGAVPSVQGEDLALVAADGKVTVNGANVTTADIAASNGVIHVIDAVLIPQSVLDAIEAFSTPPATNAPAPPKTTAPKPRTTPAPPRTDAPPATDGPPRTDAPPATDAPPRTDAPPAT